MASFYRFVIADDHPLFRGALREAVSGLFADAEIAEAGSFDDAAVLLDQESDTDLVLLDLTMPGVRGRRLRAVSSAMRVWLCMARGRMELVRPAWRKWRTRHARPLPPSGGRGFQYLFAIGSSSAGNSVITRQPLSVTTTSSSMRAAE